MSQPDRFLNACKGLPVDTTPIWIMRQAGRYLPSYREVRKNHSFLEMCRTPEVACEVTLQPIDQMGVDAAILFADILLILDHMGAGLRFEEGVGPVIDNPVRSAADVEKLRPIQPEEDLKYVMDAVRLIRKELDGRVPLIGFAGAPFTVATYLVAGGKSTNHEQLKGMMLSDPKAYDALMTKLTDVTYEYLLGQIKAGAQAVQVFDTWAGVLAPVDYERSVLPYVKGLVEKLKATDVPVISYLNGAAVQMDHLTKVNADVYGVDWKVDLSTVIDKIDGRASVQGNMDPCVLFSTDEVIKERARMVVDQGKKARGHIFNLGHGVMPSMDPAKVRCLVDAVHEAGAR